MFKKPSELSPNKFNLGIYGSEENTDLVESIKEKGIIEPIVIKGDGSIISGHRRWAVAKELNAVYVPVRVISFKTEIEERDALINFNKYRQKTFTQKMNEAEFIEETEKIKARERQIESLKQGDKNPVKETFPTRDKGQTRDKVAEKINIGSGRNYEKAKKVWETAKVEKEYQPIIEKIDKGEISINQAYKTIKQEEKKVERKETLQTKAKELPAEKFQVIYCDPPWQYNNSGLNGSAESKYPTMEIEKLCEMNVKSITAENAVIFMWATNPLLEDALKLMKAWGFEYKTNMVWVKDKQNYGKLGFYIYGQHELLLIGVKGSMLPIGEKPKSIITGSNTVHSKKPDCVYETIESMYPNLKYVELFARNTPRANWTKWGNEVGKYE